MKKIFLILWVAAFAGLLLVHCTDKDATLVAEEGVVFSPAKAYQEAYPGAVLNFKMRVQAPGTLNKFSVRFKLPGSADYVALPQYPDLEGADAAWFNTFQNVEYTLPGSTDSIDKEMRFKFVAGTAAKTYEKEYTVRLVAAGRQNLRLYNPAVRTYFNFDALDILGGRGVSAGDQTIAKDIIATTAEVKVPLNNTSFQAIKGWQGVNGTTFKVVTAANYNDLVSKYETIYKAIAAGSELTGVSGLLTVNTGGVGALSTNSPYYIAKITRNSVVKYVGLAVKKYTPVNASNISATTTLDALNEYMQLEIKQ
jgi:hypothetical protein